MKLIFLPLKRIKSTLWSKKKPHSFLMLKSVSFSLCKYDTITTKTRTIYFCWYSFVHRIQMKTFLKMCWKNCILGLDYNAVFATKWLKTYIILKILRLFFQNQPFFQLLKLLQLSGHPVEVFLVQVDKLEIVLMLWYLLFQKVN